MLASDAENPTEDDDQSPVDLPSLLFSWERATAAVLGACGAFFGGLAVFTTSNQAGSAVLLLISAAFLLIGIQGTPLTKLTSGTNTLELDKRRIGQRLFRKARKEKDPEVAQAYEEAASLVLQGIQHAPRTLGDSARDYEHRVRQAFHRIGATVQPASEPDSPIDFVATKGESRTAVMVKYRRHVIGIREIEPASNEVTRTGLPLMIVTNAPLSSKVQEFNSTWGDRHPRAEVVTWRNGSSDQQLLRVFVRTAVMITCPVMPPIFTVLGVRSASARRPPIRRRGSAWERQWGGRSARSPPGATR